MTPWVIWTLRIISLVISLLLGMKAGERLEQERQRPLRELIERLSERLAAIAPDEKGVAPDHDKCPCGLECDCRKVGLGP